MQREKTDRGFHRIRFQDSYEQGCSLSQSSSATRNCLWLGIDDAKPEIMAAEAAEHGVVTTEIAGWVPFPIPKAVLLHTHMHLTRDQVSQLVQELQHWLDTGELKLTD